MGLQGFTGGSVVKNPPAMQETRVRFLAGEDPLEEGMATHSPVFLPGKNPTDRGAWRAAVRRAAKGRTGPCDHADGAAQRAHSTESGSSFFPRGGLEAAAAPLGEK